MVRLALWRLNLTLHNFEISSCAVFFCDDNLSKDHSQLLEYSQTFQIASRYAPTVVIFSVTLLTLLTYQHDGFQPAMCLTESRPLAGKIDCECFGTRPNQIVNRTVRAVRRGEAERYLVPKDRKYIEFSRFARKILLFGPDFVPKTHPNRPNPIVSKPLST